ncbi:MAG: NUDIX domain-containing protein [Clostridia bacterium]|nr:NUDIX domain-containing protein [Clostridia bacterium]
MELWDAYDSGERRTGQTLVRGEPIPQGRYHMVCEALVRHTDGEYLLMHRVLTKAAYPGYFEATAGGSALCGEDALTCMRRELMEETGIVGVTLTLVAKSHDEQERAIFYSYLALTDVDKAAITLQQGETDGYRWLSEADFIAHIHSDRVIDRQKARYADYFRRIGYLE